MTKQNHKNLNIKAQSKSKLNLIYNLKKFHKFMKENINKLQYKLR